MKHIFLNSEMPTRRLLDSYHAKASADWLESGSWMTSNLPKGIAIVIFSVSSLTQYAFLALFGSL